MEAARKRLLRELQRPREAVEHAARQAVGGIEHRQGVGLGLTRVDDERQVPLARQADALGEDVALGRARRMHVMVVEAELAEGNDARPGGQVLEHRPIDGLDVGRPVRVVPVGGVEHRLAFGHLGHARVLGRARADVDDGVERGGAGTLQDAEHVVGETIEVDVGVGVDGEFGHGQARLKVQSSTLTANGNSARRRYVNRPVTSKAAG